MAIARLAFAGLVLLALVVALVFLVRSMVPVVLEERDDAAYRLISVVEASQGPRYVEVALREPHGYDGEQVVDGRGRLTVVVSPLPQPSSFAVVNASSPTDGSRVEIGEDRLIAADGTTWTLDGEPTDAGDPPLQRFPTTVSEGAVVVDFTTLMSP